MRRLRGMPGESGKGKFCQDLHTAPIFPGKGNFVKICTLTPIFQGEGCNYGKTSKLNGW